MNPLLLWIPGAALLVAGIIGLVAGAFSGTTAWIAIGVGSALESAGALLWMRERRGRVRGRP